MSLRSPFAVSAQLPVLATALGVIALCATDVTTLVAGSTAVNRTASLSPADTWDTFSADVTIRRHLLTTDGTPTADAPAMRYRWTRSQRTGGWKSTVEVTRLAAPVIRSSKGSTLLDQPSSAIRIEDDEDGTPVRVFDDRGRAMRLPSVQDRHVLGEPVAGSLRVPALPELAYPEAKRRANDGRDWVDAFIAVRDRTNARRESLHRRFGRAAGRVKNLDRFITADGGQAMEVLTDRTSVVPVEVNVARDGVLVAQSTLAYSAGADGTLVRQAVRTEQRVSSTAPQRAVAHVEFSNVRLERRGVQ